MIEAENDGNSGPNEKDPREEASLQESRAPSSASTSSKKRLAIRRKIARALRLHPVPELTKKEISTRWFVGPDTVRRLLREFGLDPGTSRDLTVPLTELLRFEGVQDALRAWALGSDWDRLIFEADLLTPEEKRADDRRRSKLHIGTYRRYAREGRLDAIRIGKQHRFRRDLTSAEQCFEKRKDGVK